MSVVRGDRAHDGIRTRKFWLFFPEIVVTIIETRRGKRRHENIVSVCRALKLPTRFAGPPPVSRNHTRTQVFDNRSRWCGASSRPSYQLPEQWLNRTRLPVNRIAKLCCVVDSGDEQITSSDRRQRPEQRRRTKPENYRFEHMLHVRPGRINSIDVSSSHDSFE